MEKNPFIRKLFFDSIYQRVYSCPNCNSYTLEVDEDLLESNCGIYLHSKCCRVCKTIYIKPKERAFDITLEEFYSTLQNPTIISILTYCKNFKIIV